MTHIFNVMLGVGIFGGVVFGVWVVPYVIALILDDDVWLEANKPVLIIWVVCVLMGVVGAAGATP